MAGARHGLRDGDIDELMQETRVRLWKALGTAEKIEAVPASYVYQTAATAAVDLIRQRRRSDRHLPVHELADRLEASDDPGTQAERTELRDRIWLAVGGLAAERRVAVRAYLNGYNHSEIAGMAGWTEAKARNLLYRGLAQLRERLGPSGGETR
jgi:RNA polymerase sigma-70 factor (ECF subfamily)